MLCSPHDLSMHEAEQHPRVPIAAQAGAASSSVAASSVVAPDNAAAVGAAAGAADASHFEPGSVAAVAAPLPAVIASTDNFKRDIQSLTEQVKRLQVERDTAVRERDAALANVAAAVSAVTREKDAFIEAERVRLNKEMEKAIKAERNRMLQEQKAESARVR